MKFAHLHAVVGSPEPRLAIVEGTEAVFVFDLTEHAPCLLQHVIEAGPSETQRLQDLAANAARELWHPVDSLRFSSAVLSPPNVLAIGANYAAHSDELKLNTGKAMTVFSLWSNSLGAHRGTVQWDSSLATQVDYEAELGVIIGRDAKNVSVEDALDYVFGYTVVNDITARDIQFSEAQWSRSKSFDGFTPTGPVVVTADEIADPQDLWLTCTLDGTIMQDGVTGDMIRSVAEIISTLSKTSTLKAGTLISTGSPGGAGYSRTPAVFLRDGSEVTITVQGIGSLTSICRVV